ncbi:hypothetical protein HC141_01960 [Lactobacillus mulieris]|uniref:hypothetical protein n=1 Tax=Lactobacillus mulieris TaxID=2508708 RepID=UPI001432BDF1|nr:hypothetical protein [Lactobacillus mulieris]MDK6563587.1 hypothetical protein [Lactobacillus mulieris]MDK8082168.1 hypothetical protein [Lactobacillus mulieris]NKC42712.1 hypothetical protein [Lactobacillus mulieris]
MPKEKHYYCLHCSKKMKLNEPVYEDDIGCIYCSSECLLNENVLNFYPTLKEAIEVNFYNH